MQLSKLANSAAASMASAMSAISISVNDMTSKTASMASKAIDSSLKTNALAQDTDEIVFVSVDASGSTQGNIKYWASVQQIIKDLIEVGTEMNLVFWDTQMVMVPTEEALEDIKDYRTKFCGGGTAPSCFIQSLSERKKNKLVLITDGQVGSNEVIKCDQMIEKLGIKFAMVHCYFISTGGQMNLTVSTPFTRASKFRIYLEGSVMAEGDSEEEVTLEKYAEDPEGFLKDFDEIYKIIAIKTRGRTDYGLRNHILDIQSKLQKTFARRNAEKLSAGEDSDPFLQIRDELENSNGDGENDEGAVIKMKEVIAKLQFGEDASPAKMVENNIQSLLRLCDTSSDFSFNILKPTRVTRAAQVEEVDITEVSDSAAANTSSSYICPILLDDGAPCLLVSESEAGPVTQGLEKADLDMLLDMPLFLLASNKNDELVQRLMAQLDHPLGLDVAKTMFNNDSIPESPFTRRKVVGALTFGHDKSHDASNNYTLSKIFFPDRKLVGVPELWLCVVYFTIVERVPYLAENIPLMEAFKSYIGYRLKKYKSRVTLTGAPVEPIVKTALDIAIWYSVASPRIANLAISAENRLRSFGASSHYLIKILEDILGYPFKKSWTEHQVILYNTFSWMMFEEKKVGSQWRKLIRAQYQASLLLPNNYVVMLDGPAVADENSAYRKLPGFIKLPFEEVLALADLVDKTKSTGNVIIPNDLQPKTIIPSVTYNYGYNKEWRAETIAALPLLPICPTTYRPFSIDIPTKRPWREAAAELYGCSVDKLISHYHAFCKFILANDRYPNDKWELIEWIDRKMELSSNGLDTLPALTVALVDGLYKSYEVVLGVGFANVDAKDVKKALEATVKMIERQEYEAEYFRKLESYANVARTTTTVEEENTVIEATSSSVTVEAAY